MYSSEEELDMLKSATEKKKALLDTIKQRQLERARAAITPEESDRVRKIFDNIAPSGVLTPDDITASATAANTPVTPEAAAALVKHAAGGNAAMSFDDFLTWWFMPSVGASARALTLWKAQLRMNARKLETNQRKAVASNPYGTNPGVSAFVTVAKADATAPPKSSMRLTAVPFTRAMLDEAVEASGIPYKNDDDEEDEDEVVRPFALGRVAINLQDNVTPDEVEEVIAMFEGVLEEVTKEIKNAKPRISYDSANNQVLFEGIFNAGDPFIEGVIETFGPSRADAIAGDLFHGLALQIGFDTDMTEVLSLRPTKPMKECVRGVSLRGHAILCHQALETVLRGAATPFLKLIRRSRDRKISEMVYIAALCAVFAGASYRADFSDATEMLNKATEHVELVAQEAFATRARSDDEIDTVMAEAAEMKLRVSTLLARLTRHDAVMPDLLLIRKAGIERFFGGKETSDHRVVFLGPALSGKTQALYALKLNETVATIPTIGFNVETVSLDGSKCTVWDIGGDTKLRPLWRHYVNVNATTFVFVPDSTSQEDIRVLMNDVEKSNAVISKTGFVVTTKGPAKDTSVEDMLKADNLPHVVIDVDTLTSPETQQAFSTLYAKLHKRGSDELDEDDELQPTESNVLEGVDEVVLELFFALRKIAKSIDKITSTTAYAQVTLKLDNMGIINALPTSEEELNEVYREAKVRNDVERSRKRVGRETHMEVAKSLTGRDNSKAPKGKTASRRRSSSASSGASVSS
eukprot:PhM_4_TR13625/c0_g1_i1/m.63860